MLQRHIPAFVWLYLLSKQCFGATFCDRTHSAAENENINMTSMQASPEVIVALAQNSGLQTACTGIKSGKYICLQAFTLQSGSSNNA